MITTRIEYYRPVGLQSGAKCMGRYVTDPQCLEPVAWGRAWQTTAMAAPSFFYFCEGHGQAEAERDGIELDTPFSLYADQEDFA